MKALILIAVLVLAPFVTLAGSTGSEGVLSGTFNINKGVFKYSQTIQSYLYGVESYASDQGVFAITAVQTNSYPAVTNALPINNVTAPHYCFFRNVDTNTNTVFLTITMRLEPNDFAIVPVSSTSFPVWATNAFSTNMTAEFQYGVFSK